MTFFLILALLGGLALAVAMFGGDGDDALDSGDGSSPGVLSLKTVSLFLLGFGLTGAVAISTLPGAGPLVAGIVGGAGGIGFAALGYQILKFVYGQQASSLHSTEDLLGKQAMVSMRIPASGVGQVSCEVNAKRVYMEARSKDDQRFEEGESVYIRDIEGGVLVVERWGELESGA